MKAGRGLALLWHVVAASILLIVPTWMVLGEAAWEVDRGRVPGIFGVPLAYLLSGVVLSLVPGWPTRRAVPVSFTALATVLSGCYLTMLLYPGLWYSRWVLLSGSVLAALFIAVPALLSRRDLVRAVFVTPAVAALLVIIGSPTFGLRTASAEAERRAATEVMLTSHGVVVAVHYTGHVTPSFYGGGMSRLGDTIILATGDGLIYSLEWSGVPDSLHATLLPIQVPLNRDDFAIAVGDEVPLTWFRVADVLARAVGDSVQIMATHHHWFSDRSCFVVRISSIAVARDELDRTIAADRWRTLYDTKPCLTFKDRGWRFAGNHIGGRLADLGSGRLVVTIGDFEFDGVASDEILPQDRSADYGKSLIIDAAGNAELLTIGHRNPQGLHVDAKGRIWSTEHGPQGGDVLNELVAGANYGWPFVTYGTAYGDVVWPLQDQREWDRTGFRPAVFAWVPSIGISNLIEVRRGPLAAWAGDLLVSSLEARSLYRIRREQGRVVYVEPIRVGFRIRDVVELRDGRIILWADGGRIISLSPASAQVGAVLFARCVGCHSTEQGAASRLGPNLHGIYGRPVAADPGFVYSPALTSLTGRWTAERLDAFLADPRAFAPGTTMEAEPMRDPEARAALIEYLKTNR